MKIEKIPKKPFKYMIVFQIFTAEQKLLRITIADIHNIFRPTSSRYL